LRSLEEGFSGAALTGLTRARIGAELAWGKGARLSEFRRIALKLEPRGRCCTAARVENRWQGRFGGHADTMTVVIRYTSDNGIGPPASPFNIGVPGRPWSLHGLFWSIVSQHQEPENPVASYYIYTPP